MGLSISDIKNQVKKSGNGKGKIIYFKPGVKNRIRFLHELTDGVKALFHDSFSEGINLPCQLIYGRDCKYCENDDLRHRDLYAWSVYDYEANEVKILLGAANNFSPIPALVGMFDTYGTIVDRDYVITKNGQGTSITFTVVPMDKAVFKNKKAKAFSESKMLELIDKAFPDEDADEDDEDEAPAKTKKKAEKKCPDCGKPVSKCVCDDEDDDEEDEEESLEDMTAKELFALCKEKGIKAKPKMDKEYYIDLIESADAEDEEDDEDEW